MQYKSGTAPLYVTVYYNRTRVTNETLNATGDPRVFTFDNTPVSTQKLIVTGTKSGSTRILVNYTLEPMDGTLTIPASFPEFDSVHASYYYYNPTPIEVMTKDFSVEYPNHNYELTIYGEPVYTLNKVYPTRLTFSVVLSYERQRALLTESIRNGYYVLIIDNHIPESTDYDEQAWEGPVLSDDQSSVFKGKSYLLGIIMEVCQNGIYDPDTDTIDWESFS